MNRSDAARALGATPLLAGLGEDLVDRVLAETRAEVVEQGRALVVEGDPVGDLYLVLRGRFAVVSRGQAIAAIGAGEPIGEIAFFAGGTRSASVVALRNSEVLVLSKSAWDRLSRDVPEIGQAVLAALAQRLAR
ncbi:cyclic nucleotide-binding domain-containing protein, partial [Oceaniglobus roseus]|uniref:cyclic nucleotide-binding domain-containing protein n=1 Tax=Oceaniglobus roseus TaxID=1737570 RepID=UPI001562103A